MTTALPHTMRELDSRTDDGFHVRLLWGPQDGRIAVTVADTRRGDRFVFDVPERDRALHAFRHPFAYAAWHGTETRAPLEALAAEGELTPEPGRVGR